MLKYLLTGLLSVVLPLSMALPVMAGEDKEEAVKLKDCPEAVQKVFNAKAAGGKILEIEKEVEDGAVVYEAEIQTADGKTIDVEVSADGKSVNVEEDDEDEDEDGDGDEEDDD